MKTFATKFRAEKMLFRSCALCGAGEFKPALDCGEFRFVRCTGCGLVQQNPQPVQEAVLARYDESYLEYEVARQFDYCALELKALSDLGFEKYSAHFFREVGRANMLDIGCATGALLAHFKNLGWAVEGVEACEPAARWGSREFAITIHPCTLEAAGLASGHFQVVHASHLIEHLNEPLNFLREVGRILSDDGLFLLTTPNIAGWQARITGSAWRSAIYDHLYLFSRRSLRQALAQAGFVICEEITWGGWAAGLKPHFIKKPLDFLAKKFGGGDVMAVLARKKSEHSSRPERRHGTI